MKLLKKFKWLLLPVAALIVGVLFHNQLRGIIGKIPVVGNLVNKNQTPEAEA
jgi:hypothetical protein